MRQPTKHHHVRDGCESNPQMILNHFDASRQALTWPNEGGLRTGYVFIGQRLILRSVFVISISHANWPLKTSAKQKQSSRILSILAASSCRKNNQRRGKVTHWRGRDSVPFASKHWQRSLVYESNSKISMRESYQTYFMVLKLGIWEIRITDGLIYITDFLGLFQNNLTRQPWMNSLEMAASWRVF